MNFPPVLTKADFVRRFLNSEFGNRPLTWDTYGGLVDWGNKEFRGKASEGLYHLRNRMAAGETYYNLRWCEAVAKWMGKPDPTQYYCSMMCPTERTTLQGEVMQAPPSSGKEGLALYYTTVAKPMRVALLEGGKQVYGLLALGLLQRYLCPNSYEWLQVLLERYKDHVIEFTALSTRWGSLPGFNTIVWEVRKY